MRIQSDQQTATRFADRWCEALMAAIEQTAIRQMKQGIQIRPLAVIQGRQANPPIFIREAHYPSAGGRMPITPQYVYFAQNHYSKRMPK